MCMRIKTIHIQLAGELISSMHYPGLKQDGFVSLMNEKIYYVLFVNNLLFPVICSAPMTMVPIICH